MDKRTEELNRLNNELDKRVKEQNQEIFTDMVCYIRGADISEYDQEIVRQDLLEMILSAQERGEDIASVIGGDYKEFCDDVIASLTPKTTTQKIIDFFDIICWSISVLMVINIVISRETIDLIENIITGQPLNFDISVSVGELISGVVIIAVAVIVVECITRNPFKKKHGTRSNLKAFLAGVTAVAVFAVIAWLGRNVLFTVNIFVTGTVAALLFIGHKILEKL